MNTLIPSKAVPDEQASPEEKADNTARWHNARERVLRGEADSIESALRHDAIDEIRDGEIEPRIVSPLRKALAAEKDARANLDRAEEARREADSIQRQWESLVVALEHWKFRIKLGSDQIQAAHQNVEALETFVLLNVGNPNDGRDVLHMAIQAESGRSAIALMKRGSARLEEEFRTLVRETREFGEKNGVPKDALASLPND